MLSAKVFAGEFYVSPNSATPGDGSLASPWQTIEEAINHLKTGDTLFLRGGTYYETGIEISLKGAKDSKITIRSFPGERAKVVSLDRSLLNHVDIQWHLVDQGKLIYKKRIATAEPCNAWLAHDDYLLWRYSTFEDFSSEPTSGRYCGPGILQRGKELYLRIQADRSVLELNQKLDFTDQENIDYVRQALSLTTGDSLITLDACASLEFVDIDFHGGAFACFDITGGSRDIVLRGCSFRFSLYGIVIQEKCSNVTVSNCKLSSGFPDWSRWGDIKNGDPPPLEDFNSCALFVEKSQLVTVENNCFIRCFQALSIDGKELSVRENKFLRPHEAILISPTTTAEISGNAILHALEGFSLFGGTEGRGPGTVAIHHNVVDLSGVRFVERVGNLGDFNRLLTSGWDLIGSHDCDETCDEAVFLIYNNTIIGGGPSKDSGWNLDGTPLRSSYEKHIEYNNIYVSFADGLLERTVGKSAANILWQSRGTVDFQEPNSLVVDPLIDTSKWLHVDAESIDISELRQCYRPANKTAFSAGIAKGSVALPGMSEVNYRGAVPAK